MSVEPEWVVSTPNDETIQSLARNLDCSEPLATVLANRGITDPETCQRFLDPGLDSLHDPADLPEIGSAASRIERALEEDEQIVIFADRDVDGICGCALLLELLRDGGANVGWYVPGKWDGYGLSEDAVDDIAARNADLLITVDSGTTAHPEIQAAKSLGIDVVVTDHHRPQSRLPTATACVNPRREASDYPHDGLAGGGVAFKVGQLLVRTTGAARLEEYRQFALPLAALSTLGDYVPLNLENRAIAVEGYRRLSECGLLGLSETADHCGVSSIRDLSWSLIPLLNAAQEDESGDLMLKVLFARDRERIESLIARLERYREERREERATQREHLERCYEEQVAPPDDDDLVYLVETDEYVYGGAVTGLSKQVGRPVITYRQKDGYYRGGGRSDPDVDFIELYEACDGLLEEFWGHPGAAGFRVAESQLESFVGTVADVVHERYSPEDLRPTVEIDVGLRLEQLNEAFVEGINQLRPFGPENDEPNVLLEGVPVRSCETFGSGEEHVRLHPGDDKAVSIVYWNGTDYVDELRHRSTCDIVGTVGWDGYEDQPQVDVSHFR